MRYRKLTGFAGARPSPYAYGIGPYGEIPYGGGGESAGSALGFGDYSFGYNADDFFVDDPKAVAQAVLTSLLLHQGEWFLDTTLGMPWETEVEGYGTASLYDEAIKNCILTTKGVQSIDEYSSSLNPMTRKLKVSVILTTAYGQTPLQVTF